jgi:hypothetical protein
MSAHTGSSSSSSASPGPTASSPDWIALVREKVEGLRFGVVQLTVHDGRVTQIERTEKTRLPSSRDNQGKLHE